MALSGKVVVVTGASAGIGRATVRLLGAKGAKVALLARGPERLEAARSEVEAAGGSALVIPVDIADAQALDDAATVVEERLGPIDVWINCAMTAVLAEVLDTSPDEFRRVTDVTYLGSVFGTRSAMRRMMPRDRGTIVQVGSALSRRGIPLQASYCGAKHAVAGFLDSVRSELIHHGSDVKVCMVQLPGHNTPQFSWVRTRLDRHPQPVPPIYQPEVAARAIVHAAEHPRRELWVGWPTVQTIVGNFFVPWFVDRYLGRTNYEAQQTDRPIDPGERRDNLEAPPPGDPGAHGIFDDRAKSRSLHLWLNLHRGRLAAVAGAAAAGAAAGVAALKR